jgi:hypothetical protein
MRKCLVSSEGYGGFTHTSENNTSASGTINLPANLEAFLDVNVIALNNATTLHSISTRDFNWLR